MFRVCYAPGRDSTRPASTCCGTRAATIAYALGVDWRQIQDMLGHSELGTTMNLYVDDVPHL